MAAMRVPYKSISSEPSKKVFWIFPRIDKKIVTGIVLAALGFLAIALNIAHLLESASNTLLDAGAAFGAIGLALILCSLYKQKKTLDNVLKLSPTQRCHLLYHSLAAEDFTVVNALWDIKTSPETAFQLSENLTTSTVNKIIEDNNLKAIRYLKSKKFVFTLAHITHAVNMSSYLTLKELRQYNIPMSSDELTILIYLAEKIMIERTKDIYESQDEERRAGRSFLIFDYLQGLQSKKNQESEKK